MISGLAMHGLAEKALELFARTTDEGYKPDNIAFVGVLSACSHAALLDLGHLYFRSMVQDYAFSPDLQHYGCMVNLLGRAGLVHKRIKLGESVAKRLLELEPENPGVYVLLSNIYAGAGRWDDVARIRTFLNNKGMKNVPGCSSIEVDRVVHEFLVSDKVHPRCKEIYNMLDEADVLLRRLDLYPIHQRFFKIWMRNGRKGP
ncbi:hypothetical protein F3Y22_tig00109987pilonHSYRG00235 [Hibiscus syriacus]|uniref:Pentatricopeptide repeat-containing protein n=1 Tax=Hibiscus syriacus TaxID=106335 RepID=A0A6A3BSK7_HIBSY|nr:hypothetical protein F3Y22_tig00109987pilonHSYRG00235 [Hibiscus syriacus]